MKVAVCISGQPRGARDTFPYIYNNIILPNNADVFFHVNFDSDTLTMEKTHIGRGDCTLDKNIIDDLVQLYKPVAYIVEKPRNFYKPSVIVPEGRLKMSKAYNPTVGWSDEEHRYHVLKQIMSMYYSIFKANELKENYSTEKGFTYDYVIRIRFDIVPLEPILCSTLDPRFLYYQDLSQPQGQISDWINIGSNMVMNVYSSIYTHFEYINSFEYFQKDTRLPCSESDICGGFNEYMLRDMMTLHKIPCLGKNFRCILHPKA